MITRHTTRYIYEFSWIRMLNRHPNSKIYKQQSFYNYILFKYLNVLTTTYTTKKIKKRINLYKN